MFNGLKQQFCVHDFDFKKENISICFAIVNKIINFPVRLNKIMFYEKLLLTFLFALVAMVTAQGQTYCVAGVGPTSTADSEIIGVTLNGDTDTISQNDPLCGTAGVQDFTSTDSADISRGAQYTLSVAMGTCGGNYGGAIAAWIDFNADGDFDDAGEQLGAVSGTPTFIQDFTFVVPSSAVLGGSRLRVMQQEGGSAASIAPCNSFSWGSVKTTNLELQT